MPNLGAEAVVISDGKVLLVKKKDLQVWALPGGQVDPGETVAQAAIRETREEAGIEVSLTRLVGVYSSPKWRNGGHHSVVFSATPVGGELRPQPEEVSDLGYFSPDDFPEILVWWNRRCIADALDGVSGLAVLQDRVWPLDPDMTDAECYRHLARSGLTGEEAYREYLSTRGSDGIVVEVGER